MRAARVVSLLLTALALLASRGQEVNAQSSATESITVRVAVVEGLTVLRVADLDFGMLAVNSGTTTLTKASSGIGKLRIVGENGQRNVSVTIISTDLRHQTESATLPYVCDAAYNETADNPVTATDVAGCGSFQMKPRLQNGNAREGFVYILGAVTVGQVPTGTYTGTVTVTTVY